MILSLGDNGESLWFSGNPAVGGNYTSPAGDFSTLTLTSSGYTRTLPDGTQITFNSSGYETATIDLNGLHTTYSYNGSNQLTIDRRPVRQLHDLHLQLGLPEHHPGPGRAADDVHVLGQRSRVRRAGGRFARDLHLRRLGPDDAGPGPAFECDVDRIRQRRAGGHDHAARRRDAALLVVPGARLDQQRHLGQPGRGDLAGRGGHDLHRPQRQRFQIRPDWMGLGQLSESDRPVRQCRDERPQLQRPADRLDRRTRTGSPSTTTTARACRPRSPIPT